MKHNFIDFLYSSISRNSKFVLSNIDSAINFNNMT